MIRAVIRNHVLTELGETIGDRVYPVHLPQDACYPAITFQVVSRDTMEHLQGRSDLARIRVQFDIWTPDAAEGWKIAEALRNALDGHKSGAIRDSWLAIESDNYEEGIEAFRTTQDYQITYWRTS